MKTIGIMTFHWATNYGAVLQAYSLQQYLESIGCIPEIIDYYPKQYRQSLIKCFYTKHPRKIITNIMSLKKEWQIEKFRKTHLRRTHYYSSDSGLITVKKEVLICGSDQVWNPSFTMKGENRPTLAYYLAFVGKDVKKIAYAVSFGVETLDPRMKEYISPSLHTFDRISVREKTGLQIVRSFGIEAKIVCDPVFLNSREVYDKIANRAKYKQTGGVFGYILHADNNGDVIAEKISKILGAHVISGINAMTVEAWLRTMREAKFVVTNSFHATAFSVIFHVPFISVLMENSGMNDRILTLLDNVGLKERAVKCIDDVLSGELLYNQIDWEMVDVRVEKMRKTAVEYLLDALN